MSSLQKKAFISFQDAIMFIIVTHPIFYNMTNKLVTTYDNVSNCPTTTGVFLHAVLFFVLNYVFMKIAKSNLSNGLMLKYSFYGTILYFLISNKETYKLVNKVINVSSLSGCPTNKGILVHACVYFAVLLGVMYFPNDK